MNTYLVRQVSDSSFIVQIKLAADGMDPAIHEFKSKADAEKWIAEQKTHD